YINHAHNDFIEVVIDGGIFALALLVAGLFLYLLRMVRVMFGANASGKTLKLAGGIVAGMLIIASTSDYPLRVPSIMALMAIASIWLFAKQDLPRSDA
ncbi:MAG: hypothetical protein ACK5NN_15010, partial [Sphingomonadaceae bacterium]